MDDVSFQSQEWPTSAFCPTIGPCLAATQELANLRRRTRRPLGSYGRSVSLKAEPVSPDGASDVIAAQVAASGDANHL